MVVEGTSVTRKVWDGRAQLEEFESDSAAGGHIESLALRLYNPQTHRSSLYSATSKGGPIYPPQTGEFYVQKTPNGKLHLCAIYLVGNQHEFSAL